MSLHVKDEEIPRRQRVQKGESGEGSMVVKKGEQINYVLEGEIWFFVEDRGFHCRQGDFQRIPANKTHWAWNRSDQNATVAEAHAPALIGGRSAEGAVGLFDDNEDSAIRGPGENKYVAYDARVAEKKLGL